jgi:hypothetical protein
MVDHHHRATPVADVVFAIGGAALFFSAFVHWIARGPGSGLRGHALVDTLVHLGRNVPAMSATRLTVIWYLIPACGALAWIACGLRGARSTWARVVAVVAFVASVLAYVAFAHLATAARLGWGPKLALAGATVCVAASWVRIPAMTGRGAAVGHNDDPGL